MALFPEIDEKKTRKNVKELLCNYRSFVRLAEEEYIPKVTATYSFELKSFTGLVSRATENAVVRKVTAEQELVKISKASYCMATGRDLARVSKIKAGECLVQISDSHSR